MPPTLGKPIHPECKVTMPNNGPEYGHARERITTKHRLHFMRPNLRSSPLRLVVLRSEKRIYEA